MTNTYINFWKDTIHDDSNKQPNENVFLCELEQIVPSFTVKMKMRNSLLKWNVKFLTLSVNAYNISFYCDITISFSVKKILLYRNKSSTELMLSVSNKRR